MRPIFLLAPFLTVCALPGQTLEDLRNQLRAQLDRSSVVAAESALVQVLVEPEVDTANFRVDEADGDATFSTVRVPTQQDLDVGSDLGTLMVEGSLAWFSGHDTARFDLGALGASTVEHRIESVSAMAGIGWTFDLPHGFGVRPSFSMALSRLRDRARYDDLGEQALRPLIDGLVFNFDVSVLTLLPSVTVLWDGRVGDVAVSLTSRYTFAYSSGFDGSDPVQEGQGSSQLIASDLRFSGPLGGWLGAHGLGWQARAGHTSLPDVELSTLGFDHFYEVGAGFTSDIRSLGVGLGGLDLSGSLLFGPDVRGWSLGLSASF